MIRKDNGKDAWKISTSKCVILTKTAWLGPKEMLILVSLFTKAEFEAKFLPCRTIVVIDNRAHHHPAISLPGLCLVFHNIGFLETGNHQITATVPLQIRWINKRKRQEYLPRKIKGITVVLYYLSIISVCFPPWY